jgi:hypothetical protein
MNSMLRTRLGLILLALTLPACGGGGGGGGGGTPPVPLGIVQRIPGAGATGVVRTSNLYIRLNRPAAPATVNTANVILALGGVPVNRAVTWDPATLLIAINPDLAMGASTAYTVTINAGLTDTSGVAVTPETYTITTNGNGDFTEPVFSAGTFSATSQTLSSLDLQWPAATDAAAITYEFFSIPVGGAFDPTLTPTLTQAGTTINFPGLPSNTYFEYRVRARDANGNLTTNVLSLATKTLTGFTQDVWTEIINNSMRCTKCHMPGGQEIVPFFMDTAPTAYANLVNQDAACVGLPPNTKRVVPSSSATSFMYQKISMSPPPCGDRMPRDGPITGFLSNAEIQTIRDWIEEGALNN